MENSDKKVLVIYHADCLDGFGAAYAAWRKFGDQAEYVPANYGSGPPDVTGKEVYILDFSYPRGALLAMSETAKNILVLDHHRTAQADLEGLPFAVFDMGRSGCVMAWDYFHPGTNIPKVLRAIQDRDLWRFELTHTKALTAALHGLYEFDFKVWDGVIQHADLAILVQQGSAILRVQEKDVKSILKHRHPITLAGKKIGLACNASPKFSSDLGHELANISGTFGMVYSYSGIENKWLCSLRSNGDYDVSEIAKCYGGGGHKNAAGFSVEAFSFLNGVI